MSDIKMSDVFKKKVSAKMQDVMFDGVEPTIGSVGEFGYYAAFSTLPQAKAAANAINSYDSNQKRIEELESFVKALSDTEIQTEEVSFRYGGVMDLHYISDSWVDRAKKLLEKLNDSNN